jgi:hypothetical protein
MLKVLEYLLTFVFFFALLFYTADYYHYDWLRQRLNASVFSYFQAEDAKISASMESNPTIVTIFSLLALGTLAGSLILRKLLNHYQMQQVLDKRKVSAGIYYFFCVFAGCVW